MLYRERSQRHHERTYPTDLTHGFGCVVLFAVAAAALWLSGVTPAHMQSPGAKPDAAKPAAAKPAAAANASAETGARPLRILFLGHDRTHHPSGTLLPHLAAPLARRGIQITHVYTPEEALDPATLKHYDALMIYANHKTITPAQEQAIVDFVEGGKGLVAIHCASAMFTEAPRYIPMVGGEFDRHGMGEFTAEIVAAQADHPAIKGLKPFTTTDETYVHKRHNTADRTVLMERVDNEGREPYTWVRTQGKGRVFYTAYGHDQRTWSQPGFQQLIQQGTVWAVDDSRAQGVVGAEDAGRAIRRRLRRAELREPRSGAEVSDAVFAGRCAEVRADAGGVQAGAVRERAADSSSRSTSRSTSAAASG